MLIPSERHTAADLRLWAEYEEADRVAVDAERLDRLERQAVATIRQFAGGGPWCCCCSGGKDSVVVAHLSRLAASSSPVVRVMWEGWENPDTDAVIRALGEVHTVHAPPDDTDDGREGFAMVEAMWPRRVTGIRSRESSSRRLSRAVHGVSTERSCRPIIDWAAQDVFAYLATRELPVHSAYAMLGGGRWQRERIRVDSIGGERGRGAGRAEWEREYYGDVLARLARRTCVDGQSR